MQFGGSLIRPEATGYGLVYFVKEMLEDKGESFEVRRQALALEPLLRDPCVENIWVASLSLLCLMRSAPAGCSYKAGQSLQMGSPRILAYGQVIPLMDVC